MGKPIRVAQIMGKLWAGGVEMVVFNYYRAIDKSKVQFDFYYDADSTIEPPQDLINMGARFIKIPPYQQLPRYLKTLKRYFRENNYKIVHSHINTLSVFPLYMAWRCSIPIRIAHNHSVPGGNEIKRNILKYFLRCFVKVFSTDYFACSEKAGRWMFGFKAFDEGKVFVMYNAVDFNRFSRDNIQVESLKKRLQLDNRFVIGHVGRFTFAKNHEKLLDIFLEVSKRKPDANLILVGDGELHDQIVNKIEELEIKDKVVLVGQVNNPEQYYGLANVIVLPSIFEGLSLTTIESQILGIPIVASTAIPSEAVISNGVLYANLDDDVYKWADIIDKASEVTVLLDNRADNYDIRKKVQELCQWYCTHIK